MILYYYFISLALVFVFSQTSVKGAVALPDSGKYIELTFDGNIENDDIEVSITPLKYDKKFALSCRLDDSHRIQFLSAVAQFLGNSFGEKGEEYDQGMWYTDGCGTKIPFVANFAVIQSKFPNSTAGFLSVSDIKKYNRLGFDVILHQGLDSLASKHKTADGHLSELNRCNDDFLAKLGYRPRYGTLQNGERGWVNLEGRCPMAEAGYIMYDAYEPKTVVAGRPMPFPEEAGFNVSKLTKDDFLQPILGTRLVITEGKGNNLKQYRDRIDQMANATDHYMATFFAHSFGYPGQPAASWLAETFQYVFQTYGAAGSDAVWVVANQEFIEYLHAKTFADLSVIKADNKLYVKIDYETPEWVLNPALTIKVSGAEHHVTNVATNEIAMQTNNLIGENAGIVNLEFTRDYIAEAEGAVEYAEQLPIIANKALADWTIGRVQNKAAKERLQSRLDVLDFDEGKRIYIKFGSNKDVTRGWNILPDATYKGGVILDSLVYSKASQGSVAATLEIVESFAGYAANGKAPADFKDFKYPMRSTNSGFYIGQSTGVNKAYIKISGLPAGDYKFIFLGSRGSLDYKTVYTVTNGNQVRPVTLDCTNNTNNTAQTLISGLLGDVIIDITYTGRYGGVLSVLEIVQVRESEICQEKEETLEISDIAGFINTELYKYDSSRI